MRPDEGPPKSVRVDDTGALEYITDTLLGEIMITLASITREQLVAALKSHNELGCRVGDALCKLGFATQDEVHRGLELQVAARKRNG